MIVEKEKRKVNIVCQDRSFIKGFIHINPGERILDFLNDQKENFIVVTDVIFQNVGHIHSFALYSEMTRKREAIILSKVSIKWIEELGSKK